MPHDIGVDLGTTYTCAAVARDGAATVAQLTGSSQVIPSVISIRDDDEPLVGEAAERRATTDPSRTVREFKRRFGDPAPIVLGGKPYGADQLTGHLLADVLARVATIEGEAPRRVGIAHPAAWGPFRLDVLRAAAANAGIATDDVELIPEPVAAAVANQDRVEPGSLVAVYDLGGGTFDAAVVRYGESWEVVGNPEGIERLGGIDFDQAILSHVDAATDGQISALDREQPDVRAALGRLRDECQRAKEHLSEDTETEIPIELPSLRTSVRLTRGEFEAMVRPRLADTLAVMDRVVTSAGASWDDIATVLMVGGSSRIPAVAQAVQEHSGRPVLASTNPHLAIAVGTALVTGAHDGVASEPAAAAAETTPVTVPAAAEPPPTTPRRNGGASQSDHPPTPSPGDRSRTPVLVGAVVAVVVLAVIAFLVLSGGGDDGTDDVSEQDDVSETGDGTEAGDGGAEAAAGSGTASLTASMCTGVESLDGATDAAIDGSDILVANAGLITAHTIGTDCTIGAAEPIADVSGTMLSSNGDGMVAVIDGDQTQLLLRRSGAVSTCAVGPHVVLTPTPALIHWDDGGAAEAYPIEGGSCGSPSPDPYGDLKVSIVDVRTADRHVVAGTRGESTDLLVVGFDGDEIAWTHGGDGTFGSVDGLARCGADTCAIDLERGLIHVIEAGGEGYSSVPLSVVDADIDQVISFDETVVGSALLVATAGGETVAVSIGTAE